jgi:hypothetical protein
MKHTTFIPVPYSRLILIIIASWSCQNFQAVPTAKGQALADEYGIKFFETVSLTMLSIFETRWVVFTLLTHLAIYVLLLQSAKTNLNVEEVFFSIGRDIKQRLSDTDSRAEVCYISLFHIFALLGLKTH